jgi:hypothetical protein
MHVWKGRVERGIIALILWFGPATTFRKTAPRGAFGIARSLFVGFDDRTADRKSHAHAVGLCEDTRL